MPLTQDEIDGCRDAFLAFDKDRSGTIDVWELRQVLEAMGQKPTEEELFQMISEVDDNMSGSIDFGEFLKVRLCFLLCRVCSVLWLLSLFDTCFFFSLLLFRSSFFFSLKLTFFSFLFSSSSFSFLLQVIETQKERAAQFDDESDLIDAYVACGGNADKSGCVSADMLIKIIVRSENVVLELPSNIYTSESYIY